MYRTTVEWKTAIGSESNLKPNKRLLAHLERVSTTYPY